MSTTRIRQDIALRFILVCFALLAPHVQSQDAPAEMPSMETTNANDTLRAYLELQKQLHDAQMAFDRASSETRAASERNTAELAGQLRDLEQRLAAQRTEEARFNIYLVGGFAGLTFIAVVLTGLFQWRTVNRIAEVTATFPEKLRPAPTNGTPALTLPNAPFVSTEQVDLANSRLLGAVERLEKRILELENTATPAVAMGTVSNSNTPPDGDETAAFDSAPEDDLAGTDLNLLSIPELLDRSQALLNSDRAEEALRPLDHILKLQPEHAEALVKKGSALEKLRKLNEAIECYDRAIAADSSMTIAYLYKGGLFNRLERFGEAVECYEKALRTQEKRTAALV